MKETIEVWMKEPGKNPEKKYIPNTLEFLQWYVGGYIESFTAADDVIIICNEEGKLDGLEDNCEIAGEIFAGKIIIIGTEGDEFTDSPLSEADLRERYPQLWMNKKENQEEKEQ